MPEINSELEETLIIVFSEISTSIDISAERDLLLNNITSDHKKDNHLRENQLKCTKVLLTEVKNLKLNYRRHRKLAQD